MAKLTAATINKINKELDEKRKIYILGDNEVIINKVFKDSLLDKIAIDYLSIFELVNKQKDIDFEAIRGLSALLPVLMLREFSDVPLIPKKSPTNDKEALRLLKVALAVYDSKVLGEVLNSFDQEEVQKVYTRVDVTAKRTGEIMGELAIKSTLSQAEGDEEIGDSIQEPE